MSQKDDYEQNLGKVKTEDKEALQQDTEDEDEEQSKKRQKKKEVESFLQTNIEKVVSAGRCDEEALKKLERFSDRLQESLKEVKRKRSNDRREKERIEKEKKTKARQKLLDEKRCMLCKEKPSYTMSCVEYEDTGVNGNGVKICKECYDKAVPKELQKSCKRCEGFIHPDFGEGLCRDSFGYVNCSTDFHECKGCYEFFCAHCGYYCPKIFEEDMWYCGDCAWDSRESITCSTCGENEIYLGNHPIHFVSKEDRVCSKCDYTDWHDPSRSHEFMKDVAK